MSLRTGRLALLAALVAAWCPSPAAAQQCSGDEKLCRGVDAEDDQREPSLSLLQRGSDNHARSRDAAGEGGMELKDPDPVPPVHSKMDPDEEVTILTFETRGKPLLMQDGGFEKYFGSPVVNMANGRIFRNYLQKIDWLVEYLQQQTAAAEAEGPERLEKLRKQLVVYTDGADVIWGGCDKAAFVQNYRDIANHSGAPVVFGAEMKCGEMDCRKVPAVPSWVEDISGKKDLDSGFWSEWVDCPDGVWDDACASRRNCGKCSDPPAIKYLNSGFFMGTVGDVKEMVELAQKNWKDWVCDTCFWGDQGIFATYWLQNPDKVTLDYSGALVLSLNGVRFKDAVRMDNATGLIRNEPFGHTQCFVHGNGWAGQKDLVADLSRERLEQHP